MEPANTKANGRYRLGECTVIPAMNLIETPVASVQLEPRIMRVLVFLMGRAGEVVTREEFWNGVWEDVHVGEEALNRAVSELRKALGDSSSDPRYIQTIRKVGYRLIAPVEARDFVGGNSNPEASSAEKTRLLIPVLLVAAVSVLGLVFWASLDNAELPAAPVLTRRSVTASPGVEYGAALSPQGSQVAFVWTGENGDNEDIYIKATDGRSLFRFTDRPEREGSPTWSPDGLSLAFIRYGQGPPVILIKPVLGGQERQVAAFRYPDPPRELAWSPDGVLLAFADVPEGGRRTAIHLLSLVDGTIRILENGDRFEDYEPKFSPDGKRIAFARILDYGVEDIFGRDLENGDETRLTRELASLSGFDWSGDGRRLLISSNKTGFRSIHEFRLGSDAAVWLPASGHHAKHPSASRSGDGLVFENWVYDINIRRLGLGDGEAESVSLISSTQQDLAPQYSPDGKTVAFLSSRSGEMELWLADSDGRNPRMLIRHHPSVMLPAWSPDSSRIAFAAGWGDRPEIRVYILGENREQRLTDPERGAWLPAWSTDGKRIYFASRRSGTWQIYRIPSSDGEPEQATREGGYISLADPTSAGLYFTKAGGSSLWRLDEESGHEERIHDFTSSVSVYFWTVWERSVFFVHEDADDDMWLYRLDLDSGGLQRLHHFPRPVRGRGLSISPDGAQLLFGREERRECDLIMLSWR